MVGDLVLVNGRIRTMNPAQPGAEAVAIRQGRIVAVGGNDEVRAAVPVGTETIDLRGRTATPGLNDAHAHPMMLGFALLDLDLDPGKNPAISDIVRQVQAATQGRPAGSWIVGRGYDDALLDERRNPTRYDLDAVSPDHPVLLYRTCHHIGVVNSAALALAGVNRNTPDPDGGVFDRDPSGEPTGVLREHALALVSSVLPEPSIEELRAALLRGGQDFLKSGVTSTAEAGIRNASELRAYQDLAAAGELPVRTSLMMIIDDTLDALIDLGIRTGFGDDWLRIGPAKLFSDGSIGGRTAKMRHPYLNDGANTGLWMLPPAELIAKVARAHRAGFQVAIHAIGDAAIELVIDAYEAAQLAEPRPDPRHRIEHCSITDDGLLARIASLGIVPIPGTAFLRYVRDAYLNNLGEDRIKQAYGFVSYERFGIIAAASSDAPVVSTSAVASLQTMVTRRDLFGQPVNLAEAIPLEAALRAFTVNGAYATFEEGNKGMLVPGMLGDVTVFETDLFAVEPAALAEVQVDFTISDGVVRHARAGIHA